MFFVNPIIFTLSAPLILFLCSSLDGLPCLLNLCKIPFLHIVSFMLSLSEPFPLWVIPTLYAVYKHPWYLKKRTHNRLCICERKITYLSFTYLFSAACIFPILNTHGSSCVLMHTCVCTQSHTHTNYLKLSAFVNNAFSSDLVILACQRTLTGRHLSSNELEERYIFKVAEAKLCGLHWEIRHLLMQWNHW